MDWICQELKAALRFGDIASSAKGIIGEIPTSSSDSANRLAAVGARSEYRKHRLSGEAAQLSALRKEHG